MRNHIIILFLTLLLTACVKHQATPELPFEMADPETIEHWEIKGKFSVKQPDEAVSAGLLWKQSSPDRYDIALTGPLGQGNVLLSGYPDKVVFQDAHGDKETAYNAELLLYHHTGWSMPIESMYYWVRGLPDPHYKYEYILDDQGLYARLRQHGWTIIYNSYQQVDDYRLPRKMTLNYTDTHITLFFRTWQINP
ncbi:MAG: lipoprotein insertase outer membrane protein LolB [Gammaproteobacteria bacterium]|jgi:outer membrane lipoprotein LolB